MVSSYRGNHAAGAFEIEHKIPKKWCFSLAEHDFLQVCFVLSVLFFWIESSKIGGLKNPLRFQKLFKFCELEERVRIIHIFTWLCSIAIFCVCVFYEQNVKTYSALKVLKILQWRMYLLCAVAKITLFEICFMNSSLKKSKKKGFFKKFLEWII